MEIIFHLRVHMEITIYLSSRFRTIGLRDTDDRASPLPPFFFLPLITFSYYWVARYGARYGGPCFPTAPRVPAAESLKKKILKSQSPSTISKKKSFTESTLKNRCHE